MDLTAKEGRKRDKLKGILFVPTLSVKDNPSKTNSFILETKDKEYIMYMVDQNADDARKLLLQWQLVFQYVTNRSKELTNLLTLSGPMQKNGKKTYCILRGSTLSHYEGEPSKENDISKMKGWIDLDQVSAIVTENDPELTKDSSFKLLTVDGKSHLFSARDVDDKKRWVDALHAQIHTLAGHRFATNLGKPISEKILRTAKFTRTNKGKSSTVIAALSNLNLRFYPSDRSAESISNNMHKDCISSVPLYLAFACLEGPAIRFVDFKGELSLLTPADSAEPLKEWEQQIMLGAKQSVERVVKSGGCIRAGCSLAIDDSVDEYSILTITSEGITIEVLKTKAKIEIKEGEFKSAEVVASRSNMFTITHSATHRILAPNAAGLTHAIISGIAKHRKRKTKKGRSGSKAKRTGSVAKKPRGSVAKKSGSKKLRKRVTEADKLRLRPLFDKFDADHSGSIDKQELRAVIEASLKTNVSEKLMQKYLEAEFNRHDKDGSGAIEFDEFCELYSRMYLDPELPIVVSAEEYSEMAKVQQLETGESAPKVEKREVVVTPAQKQEALRKFDEYDKDKSGELDKEELMALLKDTLGAKMGQRILERFVEAQFQLGDSDGSGTLDKAEFIDLYAKLYFAQQNGIGVAPASSAKILAPPPALTLPPPLAGVSAPIPAPLDATAAVSLPPPLAAPLPPPL